MTGMSNAGEVKWVTVGILAGAYAGRQGSSISLVHVEARQEITAGRVKRQAGQLLCGYRTKHGADDHCEDGSSLESVSCPRCRETMERAS